MTRLAGLRLERALASAQYREGRFHNTRPVGPGLTGNPFSVLGEMFLGGAARVPHHPLPVESPLPAWQRAPGSAELRVTWLGHSTTLLEFGNTKVLTDPVFGERASPFSFAGPKRFHGTPVTIAQLPTLDAVLLSHDHYDHLCEFSIRALARLRVPIVTSLGVGAQLEKLGFDPAVIHELDWWETFELPGGALAFTATPAQHFSGRGVTGRNGTLWSSWVMRSPRHSVFFSGDTGLTEEFRSIAERMGPFDLTMLEVGAWNPAWNDIHLGPAQALTAFEMLGGGTLLPVHWGTFDLALHTWDEPAETLITLAQGSGARVVTPRLGRPFLPREIESPDPWWREVVK